MTTMLKERELFIFSWGYKACKGFCIHFSFLKKKQNKKTDTQDVLLEPNDSQKLESQLIKP